VPRAPIETRVAVAFLSMKATGGGGIIGKNVTTDSFASEGKEKAESWQPREGLGSSCRAEAFSFFLRGG